MKRSTITQSGMTLIEILIVVAILASLMGMLASKVMSSKDEADIKIARMGMQQLKTSLDRFSLSIGRYPTSSEGLDALVKNPGGMKGWAGPYADPKAIVDPWKVPYSYNAISRREFTITSAGPDGKEGTDDDLMYPEETKE